MWAQVGHNPGPGGAHMRLHTVTWLVVSFAVLVSESVLASPVTVLEREQLEASGLTSLGELLQRLPEQANATNTQVNNGGSGATRVNLRGLGTERTLVVLNGPRYVAGGPGAD